MNLIFLPYCFHLSDSYTIEDTDQLFLLNVPTIKPLTQYITNLLFHFTPLTYNTPSLLSAHNVNIYPIIYILFHQSVAIVYTDLI